MRTFPKAIATIAAAAATTVTPTMAAASTSASASNGASGWVTLSQLNPAGAMALAGSRAVASTPNAATMSATAAAAQPVDTAGAYRPNPLPLPVIGVLLAVIGTAIYIAFIENHGRSHHVFLTSPQ